MEPTVLVGVPDDARIMHEELFAPIAPIVGFVDEDEVVAGANALPFRLAAYVFSNDAERAQRTAERLEAGMVGIKEMLLAAAESPFGGVKESGFGREGGALGIHDYLEPKYVRHKLIRTAWLVAAAAQAHFRGESARAGAGSCTPAEIVAGSRPISMHTAPAM